MSPRLRWGLLLCALAGACALVLFGPNGRDGSVVAEVPSRSGAPGLPPPGMRTPSATIVEDAVILSLRPRQAAATVVDSFAVRDWNPPPPPPMKPAPPPPPSAPPLPFTVLGKKYEDGVWAVFLALQGQVLVVKPTDIIENVYRVEETRPPLMTLTYLPLNMAQTMPIGAAE